MGDDIILSKYNSANAGIYDSEKWNKIYQCYLKASECSNGITAGFCQQKVGESYHYGENDFEVDRKKAHYWYQTAMANGYDTSTSLKLLLAGQ